MNDISWFLLSWLFWWAVLFGAYTAVLFALDTLLTVWRRYRLAQRRRRALAAELVRIDRQADAAVQRIGMEFAVAQQLLRDDATVSRGGCS